MKTMGNGRKKNMGKDKNMANERFETFATTMAGQGSPRTGMARRAMRWLRRKRIAGAAALAAVALAAAAVPIALAADDSATTNMAPVSTVPMATTQKVTFDNEYKPDPIEVKIPTGLVTKQLTGDDYELTAGLFTYGMYDANGFSVNDDGTVSGTKVASGTNLHDNQNALEPEYKPFEIEVNAAEAKTVDAAAVTFQVVYNEVANPVAADLSTYYVYSNNSYLPCTDTAVQEGKTYYTKAYNPSNPSNPGGDAEGYYEKNAQGLYVKTTDTSVSENKTYYTVSFTSPSEAGLYERSGSAGNYTYTKSTDEQPDQTKQYFKVTFNPSNPRAYQNYDATTGVFSYLYEQNGSDYVRTSDATVDAANLNKYYTKGYKTVTAEGDAATNRLADVSWTSETDPETERPYLTFDAPTPEGSPAMYYIVEHRTDPITGMVYDATQYQILITVESENGKLVPNYVVRRGSTPMYDTDSELDRQVGFTNQYALNSVLSSPTDEDVITYNGASYPVENGKVTIGGTEYGVSNQTVTVGGAVYPVDGNQVVIGESTYDVSDGKISVEGVDYPVVTEDVVIIEGKGYPVNADQKINLFKKLTGRTQHANEFSYALYAVADWNTASDKPNAEANPVVRGSSGSTVDANNTTAVTLSQIAFNKAGTYEYMLIEEGTDGGSGLYFDHSILKATATVTADNNFASFDVDWTIAEIKHAEDKSKFDPSKDRALTDDDALNADPQKYTFDNEYYPTPDSTDGSLITKTLAGRDWISTDDFKIQVVASGDAPELDFDEISSEYKSDVQGEPTREESYEATEDSEAQPGTTYYTYDGATDEYSVADAPDFSTGTYYTKTVTYIYTLKVGANNQAQFKPGVRTVDGSYFDGIEEKSYTEGGITFTAKRTSWDYVISEVLPIEDDDNETVGIQKDGVTYDKHTATVTVTATDNLNGAITTTSSVSGDMTFANAYKASVTVSPLAVTKTLKDHVLVANTFPIHVSATTDWAIEKLLMANWDNREHGGNTVAVDGGYTGTYTNLGGLNSISFTQADIQKSRLAVCWSLFGRAIV